jgi:hypothetical protein
MFTTTYTDVFSGKNITPAFPQYSAISLTQANLQLAWPAQFQNTDKVVAVFMDITPTAGGFSIKMPDARETGSGFLFTVNNPGNFSFNLLDNNGNLIVAIPNATARIVLLTSNATQAGLWRSLPGSAGGGAVTSVDAASSSDNLLVTGIPALPIIGAGTINFALAKDLKVLSEFNAATGFPVRTAANTWALRTITGTPSQISVINGPGIAGNPIISLEPNITGITSLIVGNLSLSANTIASTNLNGPVTLAPSGTGPIQLTKNTEISASKTLKFFADNGVNYVTFRAGASVVNQDFIWPTAAPVATQVLSFAGGSNLSWVNIPTSPGASTVDALARYSNTVGGIKDSTSNLNDAGELTLTSFSNTSIKIGGTTGTLHQTISTLTTDLNLIVAPNGVGALNCQADLWVSPSSGVQRKLRLYTTANFYAALSSNNLMTTNVIWTLPVAGGTAGYFVTDVANAMSIRPFPVTVIDNVPKFSDIAGSLTGSSLSISGAGAATGLASCTFGNIAVSVTANTIANTAVNTDLSFITNGTGKILLKSTVSTDTNTNLTLSPSGTGITVSTTDMALQLAGTSLRFRFYNTAGTNFTALQAGAAVANRTFALPIDFPATPGIFKSSSAGVMTIDALAAAAGPLRADAAGVITVNSFATTANHIAKYSDTVATFADSGCFIDANNNLSIGTSTIGTSGTSCITLNDGAAVTAVASAGKLSIGTRYTGSGAVLALFGGGDGGISVSASNIVTHKISIYANGTRYWLLASNVGT